MSKETGKAITAAWSVGDDKSFVISCASSREGEYLIGITLQKDAEGNEALVVVHDCPAIRRGYSCWHIEAAKAAYRGWFWWKQLPEKVITTQKAIKLSPNWTQVPIRPVVQKETAEV